MQTVAGDADPGSRTVVVAWSLWAVACLVTLGALVFVVVTPDLEKPEWGLRLVTGLWAVAFATVGAVITTRVRGNPIGWLLLAAGVLASAVAVVGEMAGASVAIGADRADLAYWVTTWIWIPVIGSMAVAISLFPDGRATGRFGRVVVVLVVALSVLATITSMLIPTLDAADRLATMPLGDPPASLEPFALPILTAFQVMLIVPLGAMLVRLRGATGVRRWQLLWVAFASGVVGATALSTEAAYSVGLIDRETYVVGTYLLSVSIALVPVAIGIAVVRYRLYEIDRIIGRTVVYAIVTALLGAVYLAIVLALQAIFTFRSEQLPNIVVAAITLVVAGAFTPVRRRVQGVVDRRFNRRHFDAVRLADRFGADLRKEVEHDAVEALLRRAASESVQPASIGVWVRPVG